MEEKKGKVNLLPLLIVQLFVMGTLKFHKTTQLLERFLLWVILVFVILVFLDLVTTVIAIYLGTAVEANPHVRALGLPGFTLGELVLIIVPIVSLRYLDRWTSTLARVVAGIALAFGSAYFLIVVTNNVLSILY